jgi:hypothetical protein
MVRPIFHEKWAGKVPWRVTHNLWKVGMEDGVF